MFNDHTAGFGPCHQLLSSSPQQEGSWLCHPSSCRGSDFFFSPLICFFFSSLDPYPYRRPCHARLFRGGDEGCETFHVHVHGRGHGHDRHGSTCGVGIHAYHNARPTKEGSWPTTSRLVRSLVKLVLSKTYLNTQARAFEVSSVPCNKENLRSYPMYVKKGHTCRSRHLQRRVDCETPQRHNYERCSRVC
jgi:hypothetical protein